MRYKPHTLTEVGPPSERQALKSNFPQSDRRQGIYSHKSSVTMHSQLCQMYNGDLVLNGLKLYLKNGRQHGRTTGTKRPQHFVKRTNLWVRVR